MTGRAYVTAIVQQVARERRGVLGSDHPLHPYNSPEWFGRVQTSIPVQVFARMCGTSAGVLAGEQAATAQWRSKQAFLSA